MIRADAVQHVAEGFAIELVAGTPVFLLDGFRLDDRLAVRAFRFPLRGRVTLRGSGIRSKML